MAQPGELYSSQHRVNVVTTITTITEKLLTPRQAELPSVNAVAPAGALALQKDAWQGGHTSPYYMAPLSANNLIARTTHEVMEVLTLLDAKATGQILVLEPPSDRLARSLRAAGCGGPIWGWVRQSQGAQGFADSQQQTLEMFDTLFTSDWQDFLVEGNAIESPNPGQFQVIVALELSRSIGAEQIPPLLQWLTTLLAPQGYLIIGEPAESPIFQDFPQAFAEIGVAQTADERIMTDDWTWRLTRWQMRQGAASRQAGYLQQFSLADLEGSPSLRNSLIATYREVFGGDEWAEWARCNACGRQYSRREYEALLPAYQCICGASDSLEMFHSPDSVMAQTASDLANPHESRLYARMQKGDGQPNVDAFIWGYLATPEHMAHTLLPRQGYLEQRRFQESLADYMRSVGAEPAAPIYHQAFIGALSGSRNFGLVRAMFMRVCQFAWDHHAPVFVTATIPSVNAYPLLRGIGMEVVYTYPTTPTPTLFPTAEVGKGDNEVVLAPSRLDEQGVILAGSVWPMLSLISSTSDRKLEVLVARKLRQLIA